MDIAILFNAFLSLISTGNYAGVVVLLLLVVGFALWKKLSRIELSQKPKHEKTDYNKFIEYDSIVMDELESVRQEHNADRAVILELRNGEVNLADIPSMKVYVRNERLRTRTFSVASIINGVPASFYSRALRQMVRRENYILPDVKSLEEVDFGLFQNLVAAGVKSLYAIPLFDSKDLIYGCLMLEYCTETKFLSEEEVKEVEIDAARLNGEILMMKKVETLHS